MARQLTIISLVVLGFFALGSRLAIADDIGVGQPSPTDSASSTSTTSTDDNVGVGEESWYDAFLQMLESDDG